jgi:uncharacterized DUF497 family protein
MDIELELNRTQFVWAMEKGIENRGRHGVEFTEAATVFADPLLVISEAGRNGECREKAIGFSTAGRLLTVVHIETEGEFIRIISAWPASAAEEAIYDQ